MNVNGSFHVHYISRFLMNNEIVDHSVPSILLNIMFHALMGRFQLELFIFVTYFSTVVPLRSCVSFL